MGKALALGALSFIVLGTYYNGIRSSSEHETRSKVSDSQSEVLARNAAVTGFDLAKQYLSETFTATSFDGSAEGGGYDVSIVINGEIAKIQSVGHVADSDGNTLEYTAYADVERNYLASCVPFDIDDLDTVPEVAFKLEVKVLGTAISYGGLYDVPVTTKISVGLEDEEPWGDYGSGTAGVSAGDIFEPSETFAADTPVTISARSWVKTDPNETENPTWNMFMEQNSRENDSQLVVLRDGDMTPSVPGFLDQESVNDFVAPYLDEDGFISLQENQSIYLFELGSTNTSSSAYDLQDLVVLVTMSRAGGAASTGASCESDYNLVLRSYNEQ